MNNKDDYTLLDSGSALGKNCGPLIKLPSTKLDEKYCYTRKRYNTEFVTFTSDAQANTHEVVFSEIEDSILDRNLIRV